MKEKNCNLKKLFQLRAPPGETGVLERLWAYLTIRQELDLESNDKVNDTVKEREMRALEIALKVWLFKLSYLIFNN